MLLRSDIGGTRFTFDSIKTLLAQATPERSGEFLRYNGERVAW